MAPRRLQRKRTRGWKTPENAIYVGRPTQWGNPFRPGPKLTRERMVALYEDYLRKMPHTKREDFLAPLRGKDLLCWCHLDVPCHADVLLKWANR